MKKRKTTLTTVRIESDVRDMLDLARENGLKIGYLCNAALRIHLPKLGFDNRKTK